MRQGRLVFGQRTTTRKAFVWLAATLVLVQPLCVIAFNFTAFCREVAQAENCPCRPTAGGVLDRPAPKCPDGCMCPDTTPSPEGAPAWLTRRKSEDRQEDDSYSTVATGTVKVAVASPHSCGRWPVRPIAASEQCAVLCRLRL